MCYSYYEKQNMSRNFQVGHIINILIHLFMFLLLKHTRKDSDLFFSYSTVLLLKPQPDSCPTMQSITRTNTVWVVTILPTLPPQPLHPVQLASLYSAHLLCLPLFCLSMIPQLPHLLQNCTWSLCQHPTWQRRLKTQREIMHWELNASQFQQHC